MWQLTRSHQLWNQITDVLHSSISCSPWLWNKIPDSSNEKHIWARLLLSDTGEKSRKPDPQKQVRGQVSRCVRSLQERVCARARLEPTKAAAVTLPRRHGSDGSLRFFACTRDRTPTSGPCAVARDQKSSQCYGARAVRGYHGLEMDAGGGGLVSACSPARFAPAAADLSAEPRIPRRAAPTAAAFG